MGYLSRIIHRAYEKLSARETQLADLLMQNPNHILLYSAWELAKEAKVSNSTVTRLVKILGFKSYDQLRRDVRENIATGSPLTIYLGSESTSQDDDEDPFRQFLTQEISIMEAAHSSLESLDVDEVTTRLLEAQNLGFLGIRNSHFFAAYARWQFIQFRERTRQMPGPGETIAERIADLKKGDVVVVIAIRRIVGQLHLYIEAIAKTGADVLLITDPSSLALSKHARWTIVCPVENPDVFDSYVGVLSVIRLLAYKAFVKSGRRGQNYMKAIEDQHGVLGEFE